MRWFILVMVLLALPQAVCLAQPAKDNKTGKPQNSGGGDQLSAAEKILRVQAILEKDVKDLADIQKELHDPASPYVKAEKTFQDLNKRRTETKQQIQNLKDQGLIKEAGQLEEAAKELETQWNLARESFNLAIQERKTLQEMAGNLQGKNKRTQEFLDRLQGKDEPTAPEHTKPGEGASDTGVQQASLKAGQTAKGHEEDKDEPDENEKPLSKELAHARELAKLKSEEAAKALEKVASIKERHSVLERAIELEKSLLETLRKKADNFSAFQATLRHELDKKLAEKAPQEELQAHWQKLGAAEKEIGEIRGKIRTTTDRLADLQQELSSLQNRENQILMQAESKRQEADAAQKELARLQNPFSPHNLMQWLLNHGPKALAILVGIWLLHFMVRVSSRRMVAIITKQAMRGSVSDRENRADTLVSVFRNAASLVVLVGGVLMLLEELGIPIIPLMGGAAVLGLAVAFGAQNLVRDYFSGFMVLMEDQYGINDVVKIGGISGHVERITLRVTVLRDQEGTVHFIPHGVLSTVSNMTHGWSRALFEIAVAYTEDVDRVMDILMTLAREMRRDPDLGRFIIGDPEMLGVDQLGESGVIIKFFIKAVPLSQWKIKRELLRRIKKKFDEVGIEMPSSHRKPTVHREQGGADAPRYEASVATVRKN